MDSTDQSKSCDAAAPAMVAPAASGTRAQSTPVETSKPWTVVPVAPIGATARPKFGMVAPKPPAGMVLDTLAHGKLQENFLKIYDHAIECFRRVVGDASAWSPVADALRYQELPALEKKDWKSKGVEVIQCVLHATHMACLAQRGLLADADFPFDALRFLPVYRSMLEGLLADEVRQWLATSGFEPDPAAVALATRMLLGQPGCHPFDTELQRHQAACTALDTLLPFVTARNHTDAVPALAAFMGTLRDVHPTFLRMLGERGGELPSVRVVSMKTALDNWDTLVGLARCTLPGDTGRDAVWYTLLEQFGESGAGLHATHELSKQLLEARKDRTFAGEQQCKAREMAWLRVLQMPASSDGTPVPTWAACCVHDYGRCFRVQQQLIVLELLGKPARLCPQVWDKLYPRLLKVPWLMSPLLSIKGKKSDGLLGTFAHWLSEVVTSMESMVYNGHNVPPLPDAMTSLSAARGTWRRAPSTVSRDKCYDENEMYLAVGVLHNLHKLFREELTHRVKGGSKEWFALTHVTQCLKDKLDVKIPIPPGTTFEDFARKIRDDVPEYMSSIFPLELTTADVMRYTKEQIETAGYPKIREDQKQQARNQGGEARKKAREDAGKDPEAVYKEVYQRTLDHYSPRKEVATTLKRLVKYVDSESTEGRATASACSASVSVRKDINRFSRQEMVIVTMANAKDLQAFAHALGEVAAMMTRVPPLRSGAFPKSETAAADAAWAAFKSLLPSKGRGKSREEQAKGKRQRQEAEVVHRVVKRQTAREQRAKTDEEIAEAIEKEVSGLEATLATEAREQFSERRVDTAIKRAQHRVQKAMKTSMAELERDAPEARHVRATARFLDKVDGAHEEYTKGRLVDYMSTLWAIAGALKTLTPSQADKVFLHMDVKFCLGTHTVAKFVEAHGSARRAHCKEVRATQVPTGPREEGVEDDEAEA